MVKGCGGRIWNMGVACEMRFWDVGCGGGGILWNVNVLVGCGMCRWWDYWWDFGCGSGM